MLLIETHAGVIPFVGRLKPGSDRPVLLVIGGVFPPPNQYEWLVSALAEADVLILKLPAMRAPSLGAHDVRAWIPAFREAVLGLLPGRRIVLMGVSAGCLIALGLRDLASDVVLLEPFLRPSENAALRELLDFVGPAWGDVGTNYVRDVLGIGPDAEPKDFSDLVEPPPPRLQVLVGEYEPGGWVVGAGLISVVDKAEREMWSALGRVHIVQGTGHAIDGPILAPLLKGTLARP